MNKKREYLYVPKKELHTVPNVISKDVPVASVVLSDKYDAVWTRHLKILGELGEQITKASKYRQMSKDVVKELLESNPESKSLKTLAEFIEGEFKSEQ